jgi:hypothetical protein
MTYPGTKLTVHVLDDGNKQEVLAMASRLREQCL